MYSFNKLSLNDFNNINKSNILNFLLLSNDLKFY